MNTNDINVGITVFLIVFLIISNIYAIGVSIHEVQKSMSITAYYKLAEISSNPNQSAYYLNKYLDKIKDYHGHEAIIFKTPYNDIDYHKEIIKGIIKRCNDFNNSLTTVAKERLWSNVKNDIERSRFDIYRFLLIREHLFVALMPLVNILIILLAFILESITDEEIYIGIILLALILLIPSIVISVV